jgi:hypothetical protein
MVITEFSCEACKGRNSSGAISTLIEEMTGARRRIHTVHVEALQNMLACYRLYGKGEREGSARVSPRAKDSNAICHPHHTGFHRPEAMQRGET